MALKIVLKPLAEIDLQEAVNWYTEQQHNLGEEFLYEFRDTTRKIAISPVNLRIRYKNIRAFALNRFPYNVHHIINNETVYIIE